MTPKQTNHRTLAGHLSVRRLVRFVCPLDASLFHYFTRVRRIDAKVPHFVTGSSTTTELRGPIGEYCARTRLCLSRLSHLADKESWRGKEQQTTHMPSFLFYVHSHFRCTSD